MFSRILPQPAMSVILLATWLLVQNSVSVGLVVLGVLLSVGIPWSVARFWPEYPRRVRYLPLIHLVGIVLVDILVANLAVARLTLGPRSRLMARLSGQGAMALLVPIALRQPYAITLFASIISLTPGTVVINLSEDQRTLLLHSLNVADPDAFIARIKGVHETLLGEIFP